KNGDALGTHGVSSENNHHDAAVKRKGEFALAHAACHTNPYVVDGTYWTLQELASLNIELYLEHQVAYKSVSQHMKPNKVSHAWWSENKAIYNQQDSFYNSPQKTTKSFGIQPAVLHPLDYRFLTAFILSNLARYETRQWLDLLQGPEGFLIRSFLTKTIRSYPNVFLNQMWGKTFRIGPVPRVTSGNLPTVL
ncbi:MAG: YaaC family protein, partial [Chloroflexota bacterium]